MPSDRSPDPRRFGPILDALPELVWTAGPDGTVEYLNRPGRAYVGLPLDDLLGWDWGWVLHPADLPGALAAWTEAVRTGSPRTEEFRLRRHDGVYRWFTSRAAPVRNADGTVVRWFGICTDVDDLKRAESELVVTRGLFRALVERNDDGFALVGADRIVRYVNPAVTHILGVRPGDLVGAEIGDRADPGDRPGLASWLTYLLDHPGERLDVYASFLHQNGSSRRLKIRGTNLLPDPDVRAVAVNFWPAPADRRRRK